MTPESKGDTINPRDENFFSSISDEAFFKFFLAASRSLIYPALILKLMSSSSLLRSPARSPQPKLMRAATQLMSSGVTANDQPHFRAMVLIWQKAIFTPKTFGRLTSVGRSLLLE